MEHRDHVCLLVQVRLPALSFCMEQRMIEVVFEKTNVKKRKSNLKGV